MRKPFTFASLIMISSLGLAQPLTKVMRLQIEGAPTRQLAGYSNEMSCMHLKKSLAEQKSAMAAIIGIEKACAEGVYSREVVDDGVTYYLPDYNFDNGKMASLESLIVKWQIPSATVNSLKLNSSDAIFMVGLGHDDLSDLSYNFANKRYRIVRSSAGWSIRAKVRALDICLPKQIEMVSLTHCSIDKSKYMGCKSSQCIEPMPVINLATCDRAIIPLSLSAIARNYPWKVKQLRRPHPWETLND